LRREGRNASGYRAFEKERLVPNRRFKAMRTLQAARKCLMKGKIEENVEPFASTWHNATMRGIRIRDLIPILGLSQRGVYDVVAVYEKLYGRLPKRGRARVVPEAVVDLLRRARDMVASGQATSYEAAFRALEGHVPSPEDRERIYRALEEIAARVSEMPVVLGLLRHLKEELERTKREVGQIRLILYAGGFEDVAAKTDADVKALLETPLLLRGTLRGYEDQVKQAEEAKAEEEPVVKRPVFGAKWERWARKLKELEEREKGSGNG